MYTDGPIDGWMEEGIASLLALPSFPACKCPLLLHIAHDVGRLWSKSRLDWMA